MDMFQILIFILMVCAFACITYKGLEIIFKCICCILTKKTKSE